MFYLIDCDKIGFLVSVGGVSLLDVKYKMILGDNPDTGNPEL